MQRAKSPSQCKVCGVPRSSWNFTTMNFRPGFTSPPDVVERNTGAAPSSAVASRQGFGRDLGIGDDHRHEQLQRRLGAVEPPAEFRVHPAQVHDAELQRAPHLLRGEADAPGDMHRFDHLGGEPGEGSVKIFYLFALFAQDRVVVMNNWQRHRSREVSSVGLCPSCCK